VRPRPGHAAGLVALPADGGTLLERIALPLARATSPDGRWADTL
jgi:hypothetical protein